MGIVYVDVDFLDGDFIYIQVFFFKLVFMLNFVEVVIQWKQVVERVFYSKFGENIDIVFYGFIVTGLNITNNI